MTRRSVSSWLSPGPREPIPPWVRDRWVHSRGQARQLVLELRQLHLEPALVGPRVLGEDVEDQPAAVDDLDLDQRLERLLLRRRQLVIGDEDVEAGLRLRGDELLRLALADVPVRVDMPAVLPLGAHDVSPRREGEVGELGERVLGVPAGLGTGVDRDQECAFDRLLEIDQLLGTHATRKDTGSPAGARIPAWRRNGSWASSAAWGQSRRPTTTAA